MAIDKSQPILIVDDYAPMLLVIRALLRQLGFDAVDEAADGTAALAMLRRKPYRLVISDCNMQPMTGLDLLRRVRAEKALKDLPFLMVTAESRTENVIAAREAGVSGYLMKPFGIDSFRDKICSIGCGP